MSSESLVICIYGDPGVGKTPTGQTASCPRLIVDTENGTKFLRGPKVYWDPLREALPEVPANGTCIVQGRDWETFEAVYEVLYSGQHPFRSLVIDSLSELQKRARDKIFAAGEAQGNGAADAMSENRWGILLIRMETVVRELRDLSMNPVRPLQTVVLVCLEDVVNGKKVPLIQGKLGKSLPGFVDVIAHISADLTGARVMETRPTGLAQAKDRSGVLPAVIAAPFNIEDLRSYIYRTLQEGSPVV